MKQTICKITILVYNRECNKPFLQMLWQTSNCFDWDFTKKVFAFRYICHYSRITEMSHPNNGLKKVIYIEYPKRKGIVFCML